MAMLMITGQYGYQGCDIWRRCYRAVGLWMVGRCGGEEEDVWGGVGDYRPGDSCAVFDGAE